MTQLAPALPQGDPISFGLIQTSKRAGHLSAAGAGGVTVSSMSSAEAPFDYVRIVYLNASSNSYTVTKAVVAPTSAIGDGFTPSGGNATFINVTFNNNGSPGLPPSPSGSATTITVPAASTTGANTVYGIAFSDWIPLPSVDRTDVVGSNIHLLLVRTYAAGTQYGLKASSQQLYNNWQNPVRNLGRPFRTFFKSGDCATTPANFISPTESYNYGGTGSVFQYMSRVRGLSVIGVGDSLTQGHEYTANASVTATIGGTITSGDIVSLTFANSTISGLPATASYTVQGSDTTSAIAVGMAASINASNVLANVGLTATSSGAVITITQPGSAANSTTTVQNVSGAATETVTLSGGGSLSGGSGNTSVTDYDSWGHIACAALSTAALPVAWGNFGYGGQPHQYIYNNAVNYVNNLAPDVLIFPATSPNDGTLTQTILDADWQRVTALALLCMSKGVHLVLTTPVPWGATTPLSLITQLQGRVLAAGYSCLDFYSLLSNGSSPPSPQAMYNSGDNHPNDLGYAAMATLAQTTLSSIISRRPKL